MCLTIGSYSKWLDYASEAMFVLPLVLDILMNGMVGGLGYCDLVYLEAKERYFFKQFMRSGRAAGSYQISIMELEQIICRRSGYRGMLKTFSIDYYHFVVGTCASFVCYMEETCEILVDEPMLA